MLQIKNKTGFYFPVDMTEVMNFANSEECSFYPNCVLVDRYNDRFFVYLCGEGNLGACVYSVKKSDYDWIIGSILRANVAQRAKYYQFDRASYEMIQFDNIVLSEKKMDLDVHENGHSADYVSMNLENAKGIVLRCAKNRGYDGVRIFDGSVWLNKDFVHELKEHCAGMWVDKNKQ